MVSSLGISSATNKMEFALLYIILIVLIFTIKTRYISSSIEMFYLTQVGQDVFELGQHHGSVFVFVVQFAQFNVVMVVAMIFWGLQGCIDHGNNFVEAGEFLCFFFLLSISHADFLGDVESQGINDVTEVEQVELALAMPIVDVADFLDSCKFINVL